MLLSIKLNSRTNPDQNLNTVFLHGDLKEEDYMEQPDLLLNGETGLVRRLKRSIYGLKQSPRTWFSMVVQEFGPNTEQG